jgi:hypothetical protein
MFSNFHQLKLPSSPRIHHFLIRDSPSIRRKTKSLSAHFNNPIHFFQEFVNAHKSGDTIILLECLSQLREFFSADGDHNPFLFSEYEIFPTLMSLLRKYPPDSPFFNEALYCLDGAIKCDIEVSRITNFPEFFADCLRHNSSLTPFSLRILLNITLNSISESRLYQLFYDHFGFNLTVELFERFIGVSTFSDDEDQISIEIRIVHILGRFLTFDIRKLKRSRLENSEINRVLQLYFNSLYPEPRLHIYDSVTQYLWKYFRNADDGMLRFCQKFDSEINLLWAVMVSIYPAKEKYCGHALFLIADALHQQLMGLWEAVNIRMLIDEVMPLKENEELTGVVSVIGEAIVAAEKVPFNVRAGEIMEMAARFCNDGELELKVEMMKTLKDVFEKGEIEFVGEMLECQFIQIIGDTAIGGAIEVVEPFLGIIEIYVGRLWELEMRQNEIDGMFREWLETFLQEEAETWDGLWEQAMILRRKLD